MVSNLLVANQRNQRFPATVVGAQHAEVVDAAMAEHIVGVKIVWRPDGGQSSVDHDLRVPESLDDLAFARCQVVEILAVASRNDRCAFLPLTLLWLCLVFRFFSFKCSPYGYGCACLSCLTFIKGEKRTMRIINASFVIGAHFFRFPFLSLSRSCNTQSYMSFSLSFL